MIRLSLQFLSKSIFTFYNSKIRFHYENNINYSNEEKFAVKNVNWLCSCV